jgi:hypothetical protein
MLIFVPEIANCYGDGLTAGALQKQISRCINPNVKLIRESVARGEDPAKAVPIGTGVKSNGQTKSAANPTYISLYLFPLCVLARFLSFRVLDPVLTEC